MPPFWELCQWEKHLYTLSRANMNNIERLMIVIVIDGDYLSIEAISFLSSSLLHYCEIHNNNRRSYIPRI